MRIKSTKIFYNGFPPDFYLNSCMAPFFVGDDNTVVEPFPFEMENGTEPFGTGKLL